MICPPMELGNSIFVIHGQKSNDASFRIMIKHEILPFGSLQRFYVSVSACEEGEEQRRPFTSVWAICSPAKTAILLNSTAGRKGAKLARRQQVIREEGGSWILYEKLKNYALTGLSEIVTRKLWTLMWNWENMNTAWMKMQLTIGS